MKTVLTVLGTAAMFAGIHYYGVGFVLGTLVAIVFLFADAVFVR